MKIVFAQEYICDGITHHLTPMDASRRFRTLEPGEVAVNREDVEKLEELYKKGITQLAMSRMRDVLLQSLESTPSKEKSDE